MVLTGYGILDAVKANDITITPFDPSQLNSASYDVRIGDSLKVYKNRVLDPDIENPTTDLEIPEKGIILYPGTVYLAKTIERTETTKYCPMLCGKSSWGRLGLTIHVTAGWGDPGFRGQWTLELTCAQPVILKPNRLIGQLVFFETKGALMEYQGRYQDSEDIIGSRLYKGE